MRALKGLFAFAALLAGSCLRAQVVYDISSEMISSAPTRSIYYVHWSAFPAKHAEFLVNADRSRPVLVHAHGCGGVGGDERRLQDFYERLGFHVVLLDFYARGGVPHSCASGMPSPVGHPETGNLSRINARRLELERQIAWLEENGFRDVVVSGHSEGGKVVQGFQKPVRAVVVHGMDCKERNLWTPHPANKYLVLYSFNDPWLNGLGAYPTRSCRTLFNGSQVREPSSRVGSHGPLDDPAWPSMIKEFLSEVLKRQL